MNALIGRKLGMTQVFDQTGAQVPVTVIQAGPCVVVQRKTLEKDGYEAVQIGYEEQKESRLTRPVAGHFRKGGITPRRVLREVRLEEGGSDTKVGDVFSAEIFEGAGFVDVIATTKGRGFQGVVRRHGMIGGRASHGSGNHRKPGSIGMREHPGRIFKNKRMPGHMGSTQVTTQNLELVQVRKDDNLLLVRGSVPGPKGGIILVRKSIKKASRAS